MYIYLYYIQTAALALGVALRINLLKEHLKNELLKLTVIYF